MNSDSADRLLGEYRLKELLDENDLTRTWLAEQVSVSRRVLVDELREDRENFRPAFLADIRAKASVDHPLIGSVYEAVSEPGLCFFAHELLPGSTLEAFLQQGKPFLPIRLAHILRRVAEANLQHESLNHASSAMDLDAIYVDEHGVIRLVNLVVAGPRDAGQSMRDINHLGAALVPLVAVRQPGATRILTVLSWMRGESIESPLPWSLIRDYCLQIEHQLADPLSVATPTLNARKESRKQPVALITIATVSALVGITVFALKARPPRPVEVNRLPLPGPVTIPGGNHLTPDGLPQSLPEFRIASHEVTIGEYAGFLETLKLLTKTQTEHTFDAPGQPSEKTTHEPDDWPAMLAAAKSNGVWKNLPVSLDSPVVGVDWWDAAAYAEWKQSRLPTQDEWFAALSTDDKKPAALPPGPYGAVTTQSADRTSTGLIGMAGSVGEWTSKPAPNPTNPLGEKLWVIIGGTYLKPGSNALTREWTGNRSMRRPDIGFRILVGGS